ncbi:MAG TPA: hypothetical protein VGB57_13250 [Allosphingosinicella sp.]|jgi:hypothetical protein
MEHNSNISAQASIDERADPSPRAAGELSAHPADDAQFATQAEADAWWAGVSHGLRCATGENSRVDDEPVAPRDGRGEAAEVFDPSGRRLRVDGWLPWKKARFLLVLVAGGVVADACRSVGMSVASAYALKNRRSGRAFGKMWDAILIHRARNRLADNNLSRAMNGCVEQVLKDGVVIAERRRFDNRLSMAMLTRLDRLAESKDSEEAELLRTLSEDFEDYLEVVEAGGDEEAFIEARRPREPEESGRPGFRRDSLDSLAGLSGCSDWRHVPFSEVPVGGLDPERTQDWDIEDWVRAERSHFLAWLDLMKMAGQDLPPGPECPAAYDRVRQEILATMAEGAKDAAAEPEEPDPPPAPAPPGPRMGGEK